MILVSNNELNIDSNKISILYFSAVWCGPCKVLKPVMEEISKEMINVVDIYYIDINDNTNLSKDNQIMSVPTLLFMKDGEIKNKIIGLQPKTNILHAINNIK